MAVAAGQPPRLGEVLVAHGVVTPQQLEVALAEQQTSGRPLGEIIVEKGYAPGPMVAQALATQKGGLLKTEYGFATGFQATLREDAPVVDEAQAQAHELARLQHALTAKDGEIDRLRGIIDELRAQCVEASSARLLIAERDAEIARLRALVDVDQLTSRA